MGLIIITYLCYPNIRSWKCLDILDILREGLIFAEELYPYTQQIKYAIKQAGAELGQAQYMNG